MLIRLKVMLKFFCPFFVNEYLYVCVCWAILFILLFAIFWTVIFISYFNKCTIVNIEKLADLLFHLYNLKLNTDI